MRRFLLLAVASSTMWLHACGGQTNGSGGGTGGSTATGGSTGTGGSTTGGTGTGGSTTGSGGSTTGSGGMSTGGTGGSTAGSGGMSTGGAGGTTTTSTTGTMCDPQDPTTCDTGMGCFCGGPGGQLICGCGAICLVDADCTDPLKPICCGGGAGAKGICTDACTCFCD